MGVKTKACRAIDEAVGREGELQTGIVSVFDSSSGGRDHEEDDSIRSWATGLDLMLTIGAEDNDDEAGNATATPGPCLPRVTDEGGRLSIASGGGRSERGVAEDCRREIHGHVCDEGDAMGDAQTGRRRS